MGSKFSTQKNVIEHRADMECKQGLVVLATFKNGKRVGVHRLTPCEAYNLSGDLQRAAQKVVNYMEKE
jgi:hypothetical protein